MKLTRFVIGSSLLGICNGWIQNYPAKGRVWISRHVKVSNAFKGREPAGVEGVFTKAKDMRASLANRVNLRRRKRKLRKRSQVTEPRNGFKENLARVKATILLPERWEFEGEKELNSLAEMKLILRKDLKEVQENTLRLDDGRMINCLEQFPDAYGDIRMLRFLRKEKSRNPLEAAMSFKDYVKWRKKNGIDKIRAQVELNPFQVPSKLSFVDELLPSDFDLCGKVDADDREPSFTITLHIGQWQTTKLASMIQKNDVTLEDFLLYWVYKFESVHKALHAESIKQQRMVFIDNPVDLKGFTAKQISPGFVTRVLRPWVKQMQSNYPETARAIDVFNPPRVISLLWRLMVPLLRPGTVAKIRIR